MLSLTILITKHKCEYVVRWLLKDDVACHVSKETSPEVSSVDELRAGIISFMPLIVSRAKVVYGRSSLMGSRQVPNCLALAPAKVRSHCRHQVTKPSRRYRLPFPLGLLNVAVPAGGSRSNCTLICHIVTISYCNAPPSPGKSFLPTSLDHDGTWFVPPCLWRYSGHTRSSHSWVPEWAEGITPLGATNSSRLHFYSFISPFDPFETNQLQPSSLPLGLNPARAARNWILRIYPLEIIGVQLPNSGFEQRDWFFHVASVRSELILELSTGNPCTCSEPRDRNLRGGEWYSSSGFSPWLQ